MTDRKPSPLTPRDVYRALVRHKRRAGGFFIASMVAATTYMVVAPRVYDSKGKLFVRLGRENATLDAAATIGREPVVTVPNSRTNEINTIVEALASRPTIENVVRTVGPSAIQGEDASATAVDTEATSGRWLGGARAKVATWIADAKARVDRLSPNPSRPLSDHHQVVRMVAETLKVDSAKDSSVINISYQSHRPEVAQAVVSSVIDFYLTQHGRLNRNDAAHAFFARQKADALEALSRTEAEIRDLRNQTGPVSLDGQRAVIVDRIARLEDDLAQVNSAIAEGEAKVRMLREKLASAPETQTTTQTLGIGDQGTEAIRAQFYALKSQEQEAAAKLTTAHPKLQHIRGQVAAMRDILESEPPTRTHVSEGTGEVYQQAQLALLAEEPLLASLHAKSQATDVQLAAANAQWQRLNEHDVRMAKLQRDIELYEADYRKYAANFEQTRIDEALKEEHISNINVLQQATFNPRPIRPRKSLALAVGLFVGTFGGLSLALLADSRDRRFATSEEVEADLEIPSLASIPRLKPKQLVLNGRN